MPLIKDSLIAMIATLTVTAVPVNSGVENIITDALQYDAENQIETSVRINAVYEKKWKMESGETTGTYLAITYRKREYIVPLSPNWYYKCDPPFSPGDTILLVGVPLREQGIDFILPKYVKSNSCEMYLRNFDGKTFWCMEGKMPPMDGKSMPKGKGPGGGMGGPGGGMGGPGGR